MCGRFKRGSDKQRVAKVFKVTAGLDETVFDEGDDLRPQSMQPVIYTNDDGEHQMELMRWAFKLPDRLLFNAALRVSNIPNSGRMRF
jgi:putative SOS response-associated peptidase YedK